MKIELAGGFPFNAELDKKWLETEHAFCSSCGRKMEWRSTSDTFDPRTGSVIHHWKWECPKATPWYESHHDYLEETLWSRDPDYSPHTPLPSDVSDTSIVSDTFDTLTST